MADVSVTGARLDERPYHVAYLNKKIPCPAVKCRQNFCNDFFQVNGLQQHFRAKHCCVAFTEKHVQEAKRLLQLCHGNETKKFIENLSVSRRNLVIFAWNIL